MNDQGRMPPTMNIELPAPAPGDLDPFAARLAQDKKARETAVDGRPTGVTSEILTLMARWSVAADAIGAARRDIGEVRKSRATRDRETDNDALAPVETWLNSVLEKARGDDALFRMTLRYALRALHGKV